MDYFCEKKYIENASSGTITDNAFTVIYVSNGSLQLTFLNESYEIFYNQATVIFPNIPYSLFTFDNSNIIVLRFSTNFIPEATERVSGKVPSNPIFDGYSIYDNLESIENTDDILILKAYVYELMYSYFSITQLKNADFSKYAFLTEATKYISENFTNNISLKSLADHLKYDYNYTSRLFKSTFKMQFPALLNDYRINKASSDLIKFPEKNILEIAYDCGYTSLRTFNRNFLEITGTTPKEYRQNNLK